MNILLAFWRGADRDAPVLLYEMLRRQGSEVARFAIGSGSRSFALAVRQCTSCRSAARCQAWLDAGERKGFEEFCSNAGYVSRVRMLATIAREPG